MCSFLSEVRALMTFPRLLKLLLIFFAYYSCTPWHPVLPTFSDPAKSTKYSLLCLLESFLLFLCMTWTMKREWLRELLSFMPVKATFLLEEPVSMVLSICSLEPTLISVQFWMKMPLCLSSLIYSLDLDAT